MIKDLQRLRNAIGLSQEELAWRVGISRVSLSQIETGERKLNEKLEKKLRETVLVLAIKRLRSMMTEDKRVLETVDVVKKLNQMEKETHVGYMAGIPVAIFHIHNPDLDPIVTNAVWALSLYHQEITRIDIVLLDDYNLDNLAASL